MIVSDAPNCGVTYNHHSDDSSGVIYNHNMFIVWAIDCGVTYDRNSFIIQATEVILIKGIKGNIRQRLARTRLSVKDRYNHEKDEIKLPL